MLGKRLIFSSLLIASLFANSAKADYFQIDISQYVNWNITQAPQGGWPFNTYPGENAVSTGNAGTGIPFYLLGAQSDNVWLGLTSDALVINTNIESPTVAYTLFNTHWGQAIPEVRVEFFGTNNTSASFTLTGGANIRDWYTGNYTNTLSGNAQNWWSGPTPSLGSQPNPSQLDMQSFNLGSTFLGETLTHISVTALPGVGSGGFAPFLSGVTVSAPVPEPESYALILAGILLVGFATRRKQNI